MARQQQFGCLAASASEKYIQRQYTNSPSVEASTKCIWALQAAVLVWCFRGIRRSVAGFPWQPSHLAAKNRGAA